MKSWTYTVQVRDADFLDRMRPAAILDRFQEAATADWPYDHAQLLARGQVWILARISARVLNTPKRYVGGDVLRTQTRHNMPGAAYVDRDFLITGENGDRLVEGTSRWCLLGARRGGLIRIRDCAFQNFPTEPAPRLADVPVEKLARVGASAANALTFAVLPSDLDLNMHVNNAKYADYLFNAFSLEELKASEIAFFSLNFLKELKCGQTVSVWKEKRGDKEYGFEIRDESGTLYLTAEMRFR
ncbi:acyl-ACP thioesterase [Clostridia bacterium]|nr:acyl-ACP thioesterase [Clostridia bacterium]